MVIATTTFIPNSNDNERWEEVFKNSLDRVGGMERAKTDSCKQVYKEDGSYTYSKIAVNRIRIKVQEYFNKWDVIIPNVGNSSIPC